MRISLPSEDHNAQCDVMQCKSRLKLNLTLIPFLSLVSVDAKRYLKWNSESNSDNRQKLFLSTCIYSISSGLN
jgi:hypothetical protein